MSTTTYRVTGMTCSHCVAAVSEEIGKLDGVREVTVELSAGGTSAVRVISDAPLAAAHIEAAVDEAGYEMAGAAP